MLFFKMGNSKLLFIKSSFAVALRCYVKKVFIGILQISQGNIKKETLVQVFSCEFCEISKNTFLTQHLRWLVLNKLFSLHCFSIYPFFAQFFHEATISKSDRKALPMPCL